MNSQDKLIESLEDRIERLRAKARDDADNRMPSPIFYSRSVLFLLDELSRRASRIEELEKALEAALRVVRAACDHPDKEGGK